MSSYFVACSHGNGNDVPHITVSLTVSLLALHSVHLSWPIVMQRHSGFVHASKK